MLSRGFDIVMSLGALCFFSPLFFIVMVLIRLESAGPIFFCQRRIGINDQEFTMYKFRTMQVGTPNVATEKLTDSQSYITAVGYYLRKYSIDELPQLLNIIKGDMAIVGPRPALYNQYDLREKRNRLRVASIRPGLTGWAQINGRDDISLEEKVELDAYYLDNRSFLFDLRIIAGTIGSVVKGTG
ncbi:sugar transferase [Anaeromusa acidaminophila]|uniref:sugar transferase n=1 Tax=Anaeromusa acidaminophila TaxID=81464 RepID=UPI0004765F45|nr:sugar transferase [Anaeromusa acidaminophila]